MMLETVRHCPIQLRIGHIFFTPIKYKYNSTPVLVCTTMLYEPTKLITSLPLCSQKAKWVDDIYRLMTLIINWNWTLSHEVYKSCVMNHWQTWATRTRFKCFALMLVVGRCKNNIKDSYTCECICQASMLSTIHKKP